MRGWLRAGFVLALCWNLAASAAPSSWKLATGYRAESFHTRNLEQFAQEVGELTRDALRIELHPNNSLVKLNDIRGAVQAGRVEAGETIMTSMVQEIPLAGADSVPFVVGSYKDAQRLWQLQRPGIERHLAARGLHLLYAVPWPPQGLFTIRPVKSQADFRGSRMRTYNQTTVRIAELMGAQAVDMPMVEVGRALAEGRIDSMITSAVTGVENKVWDQVKYFYEINAWFPKNVVLVNTRAWNALAPATRAAVTRAATQAEQRGWVWSQELASSSVAELQKNGVKIERAAPEFEREIKRLGERFSREWVRSVGNEANDVFVPYYSLK